MKFVLKQNNRDATDEEILNDLKKVAEVLNKKTLTTREYDQSKINRFNSAIFYRRIGSWNKALKKAGLKVRIQVDISDIELLENIEQVWLTLGRQPGRREMIKPISKYSERPYARRYGTWIKALQAFVEFMNSDIETKELTSSENKNILIKDDVFKHKTKRDPSLRLKVRVLMRDGNKCQLCGITVTGENIHFDHIKPWSKGGETVLENLRILCAPHNLAKGNIESDSQ